MFNQLEALNRAKTWAEETSKTHLIYQDQDGYFLAITLEPYESDPQGYRHCHVIQVIEPQAQKLVHETHQH